jgi:hypothetical protein
MSEYRNSRPLTLALAAVLVAACGDGLGVRATGDVAVSFQRQGVSSPTIIGPSVDLLAEGEAGTLAVLSPDTVASLTVTVTGIQFLPQGDDEEGAQWVSLALETPVELDLMALPTEDESPLVIAAGELAVGTYAMVRFFVTNPTIVLKGSVSIGAAVTIEGGVPYAVTIPSAAQTGIKTDLSFTVSETDGVVADVGVLFDATTSLGNVILTGNGQVMMSPVLKPRT